MTPRHIALALLVVLIWGLNFVVIHEGLAGIPPLLFVAIRFACILPIMAFVPRPQVAWRDLALVGLLMSAGQFGFLYSAMAAGLASGLASLILQAQALFTVVIAAAVLGERPRPIQLMGMGIAVGGLFVVALGRSGATPLVGVLLCLAGALSWGAGNVASRRCAGASGLGLTVWGSLFVPLPMLVLSLLVDGPGAVGDALTHFGGAAIASTAYTVILASLVGYTIWNGLMGIYPASNVAPFTLLVPVVGFLAGWVFLGERPNAAAFVGGALLLVGVAVIVLGPRALTRLGARRQSSKRSSVTPSAP